MAKEGQWMFNFREDGIWGTGSPYDNKEDAIKEGIGYCDTDETHFYVGQISKQFVGIGVDASRILEDIAINVYDEVGEVADDYLCHVKREHENILEERLNKVVTECVKEFGYEPNFFKIINVEKIELESEIND